MKSKKFLLIFLAIFFMGIVFLFVVFWGGKDIVIEGIKNEKSFDFSIENKLVYSEGYHRKIFEVNSEKIDEKNYEVVFGWIKQEDVKIENDKVSFGLFPYVKTNGCIDISLTTKKDNVYFVENEEEVSLEVQLLEDNFKWLNYKIIVEKGKNDFWEGFLNSFRNNEEIDCQKIVLAKEISKIIFQAPQISPGQTIEASQFFNHYMWRAGSINLIVPNREQGVLAYIDKSNREKLPSDPFVLVFGQQKSQRFLRLKDGSLIKVAGFQFLPFNTIKNYSFGGNFNCSKFNDACVFVAERYIINSFLEREGTGFTSLFEYQMSKGDSFDEILEDNTVTFRKKKTEDPEYLKYLSDFGWVKMDVSEVVEGKKSNVKILEKQDKKHFEQGVFYIKGKTRCELKEIETLADLVLSCLIKIDLIK